MAFSKRVACVMGIVALMVSMCVCIVGCGKQPAATWSHGEVSEDDVTTVVNNLHTYYGITDDDTWALFVKQRAYDTSSQKNDTSSTSALGYAKEKEPKANLTDADLGSNVDLSSSSDSTTEDEPKDETGTVEELREYVIEQIIRQRIIDEEIKARNITVSDAEVDETIDQLRQYVEAQYMEGVFESFLQMQGYADLNAYKKEIREQLIQVQLQKEIAGTITGDDGKETINSTKWNEWLDGKYAEAKVKINPPTIQLPYALVETSSSTSQESSDK